MPCAARCEAVFYCRPHHRALDRANHEKKCEAISRLRKILDQQENSLRNGPWDRFTPPNLFVDCIGRFWAIAATRDYLRARYRFCHQLLDTFGSLNGRSYVVETVLGHCIDMLWLNRSDSQRVRERVPALYLRLGRDQDSYDFLKWWMNSRKTESELLDINLPYLNVQNADLLEHPEGSTWSFQKLCLSHLVALVLLKIRILLDIQALLDIAIIFQGRIPAEIIDMIARLIASDFLYSRLMCRGGLEHLVVVASTIKSQILRLYRAIDRRNLHFWAYMLDKSLTFPNISNPNFKPYAFGSMQEVYIVANYNYLAMIEARGSLELLIEIRNQMSLDEINSQIIYDKIPNNLE